MEKIIWLRGNNQVGNDVIIHNDKILDPVQNRNEYDVIKTTIQNYSDVAQAKKNQSKKLQNQQGYVYKPDKNSFYVHGSFIEEDNKPQQIFDIFINGISKKKELREQLREFELKNQRRISNQTYENVDNYYSSSLYTSFWSLVFFCIIIIFILYVILFSK